MALANVLVERHGRVARVTVNRPDKLNALNVATRNDIVAAFEELARDDEVRVVVVTGAGEKAFVAGADINEFAGTTAVGQRAVMRGSRAFDAVEDCPKPVIAMINGFALGGGLHVSGGVYLRPGPNGVVRESRQPSSITASPPSPYTEAGCSSRRAPSMWASSAA